MKKKLVVLNTTIMLGLGAFAIPSVDAASLNSQKAQIQKQRQDVQSSLSKADQQLTALLEERAVLDAQVKRVLQAIADNNNLIGKTQKDIVTTKAEVEQLKADIAVIQERIDKRNEILKERAIAYQENGNSKIGYVEVLLGSTSFGDFIERVGAVTTIVEADQDIIAQHDADKKAVEEKKASVEKKLSDLESMKVELEGMRAQMEEQKQQNDQLVNELNAKEKEVAVLKASLKIQDSTLASKEAEIKAKLAAASYNYTPKTKAPVKTNSSFASSNTSSNQQPAKEVSAPEAAEKEPVNNEAPAVKGDVNTVIKAGYKYFGNSVYVFGGGRSASDIANGRFDCSGFVSWAYSQAGVKLPAYTESLKGVGRQVSASDMRPGDLVFFDTYKRDGHVGIYIGGGKFIGSQSSTGVAIANMSSGYWKNNFNGRVIRIF